MVSVKTFPIYIIPHMSVKMRNVIVKFDDKICLAFCYSVTKMADTFFELTYTQQNDLIFCNNLCLFLWHVVFCYAMYVMFYYAMLCFFRQCVSLDVLFQITLFNILENVFLCYAFFTVICCAMFSYAMLCFVIYVKSFTRMFSMPYYVSLCYAMLCFTMFCFTMSCYVSLLVLNSTIF